MKFVGAMLTMLQSTGFMGLLLINCSVLGTVATTKKMQGYLGNILADDAARSGMWLL